ncbi:DUF1264-domain-containing protein [Choiromyces venosus 120613-1]|uniref:DUF1264-domain-containing protein n=1 Tax=Choiromyces venosus 120613-1 TaxID=1336337 RepID=A0A3N4J7T1_9PEZI|nr:DUF1264-domain-containing protein [Choiromyces venosus 120613-1]
MAHCGTSNAAGEPVSTSQSILEGAAKATQNFDPVNNICAWLNAFHVYADDPTRIVEAQHYCAHITEDIRQCIIYDSPEKNARLIGIEYMITPRIYETLPAEERKLWHSHVFEVKGGVLIMPKPPLAPEVVWEKAETAEMEELVKVYGKTYHLWQVDRGDKVPLGAPMLMGSFLKETERVQSAVNDRNQRFGVESGRKVEIRKHIEEPVIHPVDSDRWDHSKHP